MGVLPQHGDRSATRPRFRTVAHHTEEGTAAIHSADHPSAHSHRVSRESLPERLNGVGMTPLSRNRPSADTAPQTAGPVGAGLFDGRYRRGVASVCWSSEAQWACEPDPLPDLAVAPGSRVAPYPRLVGGGSRFPCAERPIRPATSPGAGAPFPRAG